MVSSLKSERFNLFHGTRNRKPTFAHPVDYTTDICI